MAYTSLIPVRRLDRAISYVRDKNKITKPGSLEEAVDYALNRDKTESVCFETGLSCLCETAFADMKENVQRWHKTGGLCFSHRYTVGCRGPPLLNFGLPNSEERRKLHGIQLCQRTQEVRS